MATDMMTLDDLLNNFPQTREPALEIVEEPRQKGYRFRYKSEGTSHGPLLGVNSGNSSKKQKTYPTVKIVEYEGPAKILVALVSVSDPPHIHANNLVGENVQKGYAIYTISESDGMVAQLSKLSIENVTKEKTLSTLVDKLYQEEHIERLRQNMLLGTQTVDDVISSLPGESGVDDADLYVTDLGQGKEKFKNEAKRIKENLSLGAVRLRIEAFLPDPQTNAFTRPVPPVYSKPIYDHKSHTALKIVKMSHVSGSVHGDDQVILLCEKVTKDDIEIRFFTDGSDPAWEDYGRFKPTDVHKQTAITFKTPSYKDKGIPKPVVVKVQLRRKKDKDEVSAPVEFTYQPEQIDNYMIGKKRRKTVPESVEQFLASQPCEPVAPSIFGTHAEPTAFPSGLSFGSELDLVLESLSVDMNQPQPSSSTAPYL